MERQLPMCDADSTTRDHGTMAAMIRGLLPWMLCIGIFAVGCGNSTASGAQNATPDAAHPGDAKENGDVPGAATQAIDAQRNVDDALASDVTDIVPGVTEVGTADARSEGAADPAEDGSVGGTRDAAGDLASEAAGETAADSAGKDTGPMPEAGAGDGFSSGVVRFCVGKGPVTGSRYCRTAADCGPVGPVVCSVGVYDWGPAACPIPPSMQPCPAECTADEDCTARAGGTCTPYTRSCPRCDGHTCSYPPPPCTSSPASCGTGQRCRSDGTCEVIPCTEGNACGAGYRCSAGSAKADRQGCEPMPCDDGYACGSGTRCSPGSSQADGHGCALILCNEGYACPADTRCSVGSVRADMYGCEYVPCGEGYACPENTRCTVSAPAANSHGCTTMSCTSDGDCDCGYCVGGVCSADPGTCQSPPA
jgi:hypothetical protein